MLNRDSAEPLQAKKSKRKKTKTSVSGSGVSKAQLAVQALGNNTVQSRGSSNAFASPEQVKAKQSADIFNFVSGAGAENVDGPGDDFDAIEAELGQMPIDDGEPVDMPDLDEQFS